MEAARANTPEAIAVIYRLESLGYASATGTIQATVSCTLKDLRQARGLSLGRASARVAWGATGGSSRLPFVEATVQCISAAFAQLLGDGKLVEQLALLRSGAVGKDSSAFTLSINATVFEEGTRLQSLRKLRQLLLDKKYTTAREVRLTASNLTATIRHSDFRDVNDLLFAMMDLFSSMGLELTEGNVAIDGNHLILKP